MQMPATRLCNTSVLPCLGVYMCECVCVSVCRQPLSHVSELPPIVFQPLQGLSRERVSAHKYRFFFVFF